MKKQIEDEKSNTFSASPKNMKLRPYKLQAMLKTFVQKFLEYFKYFFRYDLQSKNGQNLTKSDSTWQIPGAPTEYMFFLFIMLSLYKSLIIKRDFSSVTQRAVLHYR